MVSYNYGTCLDIAVYMIAVLLMKSCDWTWNCVWTLTYFPIRPLPSHSLHSYVFNRNLQNRKLFQNNIEYK